MAEQITSEPGHLSSAGRWILAEGWRFLALQDGSGILFRDNDYRKIENAVAIEMLHEIAAHQTIDGALQRHATGAAAELGRLARENLVHFADRLTAAEAAYWTSQSVGTREAADALANSGVAIEGSDADLTEMLARVCSDAQLAVRGDARFHITAASHYLAAEVMDLQAARLRDRDPWLLVQPYGDRMLIGPLLIAGVTACVRCLTTRLQENRWLERALPTAASLPRSPQRGALSTTLSMALGLTAHEAARWIIQQESALLGTVCEMDSKTLRMRHHRIERLTECPDCSGLGRTTAEAAARPNFSEYTGFMRRPVELTAQPAWPVKLFGVPFVAPLAAGGSLEALRPQWAVGRARNRKDAKRRAIAEAIERRSSCWHGTEPCVRASYESVAEYAIHPDQLHLYSDAQYGQAAPARLEAQMEITWRAARNLANDQIRLAPAAYCYLGFPERAPWSPGADSNGCAAAPTWERAALGAICELIEREAAAMWWYNRVPRPVLALEQVRHRDVQAAARYLSRQGLALRVLDLTTDWQVPVYAAVLEGKEGLFAAFGCSPDPWRAVWQAVSELFQMVLSRAASHGGRGTIVPWTWHGGEAAPVQPHTTAGGEADLVERIVSRGRELGVDAWFVDLTRPGYGLQVVRAILPGVRPATPRFAPGRLYDVPVQLGWLATPRAERELASIALPL